MKPDSSRAGQREEPSPERAAEVEVGPKIVAHFVADPLLESNIVLGVTGSIAAYKALEVTSQLVRAGARVDVVMTRAATEFIRPIAFRALTHRTVSFDLWAPADELGMDHIRLAREADIMLVAPATADTIARLALGRADDALTATALALKAPLVVAPAMEPDMWTHPATQANVATLVSRGCTVIGPADGRLASGKIGVGRMEEPDAIVDALRWRLSRGGTMGGGGGVGRSETSRVGWSEGEGKSGDVGAGLAGAEIGTRVLAGRKVLVSAGPTREAIDPIRFLSNRSTGRMGIAIAEAARDAGAEVVLVLGPVTRPSLRGVDVREVESAAALSEAVMEAADSADVIIMSAAVADFTPAVTHENKIKKGGRQLLSVELERTRDVLGAIAEINSNRGATANRPYMVGFAAETVDLESEAKRKLEEKKLDLIVANLVPAGFGDGETEVLLLSADGSSRRIVGTKRVVAGWIVGAVAAALASSR